MKAPIITWIYKGREIFDEAFLGAYQATDLLKIEFEIWNNRFGAETVQDLSDTRLVIAFKDYEDSALLNHIQVKCDNYYFAKLEIENDRGYIKLPKVLKGTPNTGASSAYENFISIELTFDKNIPVKSDLKALVLDIL